MIQLEKEILTAIISKYEPPRHIKVDLNRRNWIIKYGYEESRIFEEISIEIPCGKEVYDKLYWNDKDKEMPIQHFEDFLNVQMGSNKHPYWTDINAISGDSHIRVNDKVVPNPNIPYHLIFSIMRNK